MLRARLLLGTQRRLCTVGAQRRLCTSSSTEPAGAAAETGEPAVLSASTDTLPGYSIERYVGLVEGSTVRTKNAVHDVFAAIKQVTGGELTSYTDLLREARAEAMERMNEQAAERGANAVLGVRIVSSSVAAGASEILMYGTAVVVAKE